MWEVEGSLIKKMKTICSMSWCQAIQSRTYIDCSCSAPACKALENSHVRSASVSDVVDDALSFFFSSRRRHTRYIGDWSSDVCSSDLCLGAGTSTLAWSSFKTSSR